MNEWRSNFELFYVIALTFISSFNTNTTKYHEKTNNRNHNNYLL